MSLFFTAYNLPAHTGQRTVDVASARWLAHDWGTLATCFIQENGPSVVICDYSGGASYTTVYASLDKAALPLGHILKAWSTTPEK